jgi:hypothetical protein
MLFVKLEDGSLLNLAHVVTAYELPESNQSGDITHQAALVTGQVADLTTSDFGHIKNRLYQEQTSL